MPYDDQSCQNYIDKLSVSIESLQSQLSEQQRILNNLQSIKTRKQKTPHQDGSITVDDVIPTDPRTGQPFDPTTRDTVFDINKVGADKVLK